MKFPVEVRYALQLHLREVTVAYNVKVAYRQSKSSGWEYEESNPIEYEISFEPYEFSQDLANTILLEEPSKVEITKTPKVRREVIKRKYVTRQTPRREFSSNSSGKCLKSELISGFQAINTPKSGPSQRTSRSSTASTSLGEFPRETRPMTSSNLNIHSQSKDTHDSELTEQRDNSNFDLASGKRNTYYRNIEDGEEEGEREKDEDENENGDEDEESDIPPRKMSRLGEMNSKTESQLHPVERRELKGNSTLPFSVSRIDTS